MLCSLQNRSPLIALLFSFNSVHGGGWAGYDQYRHDFGKLIWKMALPKWNFDNATYDRPEDVILEISEEHYSNVSYIQVAPREVYIDFLQCPESQKDGKMIIKGSINIPHGRAIACRNAEPTSRTGARKRRHRNLQA